MKYLPVVIITLSITACSTTSNKHQLTQQDYIIEAMEVIRAQNCLSDKHFDASEEREVRAAFTATTQSFNKTQLMTIAQDVETNPTKYNYVRLDASDCESLATSALAINNPKKYARKRKREEKQFAMKRRLRENSEINLYAMAQISSALRSMGNSSRIAGANAMNMSNNFRPQVGNWSSNLNRRSWKPTTIYHEDDCLGAVVNNRCIGAVNPTATLLAPLAPKCYGPILNGECMGAQF